MSEEDFTMFVVNEENSKILIKLLKEQGDDICKKEINKEYIKSKLSNYKFGWLKQTTIAQIGQKRKSKNAKYISSFILCSIDEDLNAITINLLCNRNALRKEGMELLQIVENYALNKRYKFLQLQSIGDRVSYYKKRGFYTVMDSPEYKNIKCEKLYYMRKKLLTDSI